jgi:hypothetical protein
MRWLWPQWRRLAATRGVPLSETTRFFWDVDRVGRDLLAGEDEMALVGDDPLDGLTLGELQGLGDGGREVDVILLACLAADELDLGWESHGSI